MKRQVRSVGVVARLALVVAVASDASAWVVRSQPTSGESHLGWGVAVGPDGNPVVAAQFFGAVGQDFRVTKYAAGDGAEIWSFATSGVLATSEAYANVVAIEPNGDAVVGGGATDSNTNEYDGIVVKLSGADGALLWRHDFADAEDQIFDDLALFSDGDVAVIDTEGDFSTDTPIVRRLDAATGNEEWATPITGEPGAGYGHGVAVDAADDVVFTAQIPGVGESEIVAGKLAGTSGSEIWRTALPGSGVVAAIAIDALGDVIAAGDIDTSAPNDQHALVAKYAGGTGALLWRYDMLPVASFGYATSLGLDAVGDVYTTGRLDDDLVTAKVDGMTGTEQWRSLLSGKELPAGSGLAISAGVPIVTGSQDYRFMVMSLDPSTGATLWIDRLPGGVGDGGAAIAVAVGGGYVFACGATAFSLSSEDPPTNALTVERLVDPNAPPVVGDCTTAPRGDCRGTIEPKRAKLSIKDMPAARSDRLQWKLAKGEATTLAEFGDPLVAGNEFTLCLYDATTARIFSVAVPSGTTCGGVPCWRTSGSASLLYRSAHPREPEELDRLKLTTGTAGKTKIAVTRKGRGTNLDIPVPAVAGLTLPLTIQLQQDGGNCFTSTFSANGVIKHDGVTFKALSD